MPKLPSYHLFPTAETASKTLAAEIGELVSSRAAAGQSAVLGLATGSTPIPLYEELVCLHRNGLSFANVTTFNLDEYLGLERKHEESYWHFMHTHLFDHINIPPGNIHIPDGTVADENLQGHCLDFENAIVRAGGIDLQVLGIGRNGHIGFNEPGASPEVRTHVTSLNEVTIADAAESFDGPQNVPARAITMGVGTILDARRVVLLAFGGSKAGIIKRALTPGLTPEVPATYLQLHDNVSFFVDADAGAAIEPSSPPE